MALVLNPYNALSHIHDVGAKDIKEDCGLLVGAPVVEAQMHNIFGALRLHKHFNVASDEIVVASEEQKVTFYGTESVAPGLRVEVIKRNDAGAVLPMMWSYDAQGKAWAPVQYIKNDGGAIAKHCAELLAKMNTPAALALQKSIGKNLVEAGLNETIGMSLRFIDPFGMDHAKMCLNESTCEKDRVQVFTQTAKSASEFSIDTHFFYDVLPDGDSGKPRQVTCGCTVTCCDQYGDRVHVGTWTC